MSGGGLFPRSELRLVRAPRPTIPRCGECGLLKTCRTPKMPVDGRGERGILIVGEAPGADEDEQGKPFVGKTGRHLAKIADELGVNIRRDCWLYNAVICRPPNNKMADYPNAVDYCRANLLNLIKQLRPNVTILLGGEAVDSLMSYVWRDSPGGISKFAGFAIPAQRINSWVCPTWHPSYLVREESPVLDAQFRDHLTAAFALDAGPPWPNGVPDFRDRVEVLTDPGAAAARIAAYTGGLAAFDYETETLKPDGPDARIVSCSICWNGRETIAFPWHGPVIAAVERFLTDPDVGKVASNLKFEERWTRKFLGVRVRNWAWDIMLAAHAADSRPGISGLKFQALVCLGQPDFTFELDDLLESKESGGNAPNRIREIGLRQLLLYNGLDSFLEYRVAKIQAREMGVNLGDA